MKDETWTLGGERPERARPVREIARYLGHLSLPEVGPEGQQRLAASSVLCIGTGGLGSPAALYLAAAGVGRIGLVDSDVVEASNLNRQILFRAGDVGASKVQVARETLAALNPDVDLVLHEGRLDAAGARPLFADYDVILDGTDNFPTRYLINDACVALGKPDVWASVYRFEGQLAVFDASRGPCYRCLFPEMPPPELVPSCAEAGVLGVLPGIMGTLQALEVVKLILGIGQPLIGRLLVFDGLTLCWRELALERDPACPTCCRGPGRDRPRTAPAATLGPEAISAMALNRLLQQGGSLQLIDCREPFEWQIAHLPGSVHIPLPELSALLAGLDRQAPSVVVCHHGPRSRQAASAMRMAGFQEVSYLEGGLDAWAREIDPGMPRY